MILKVRNTGNSAAVNVEIIYDGSHKHKIPILSSGESLDVKVYDESNPPARDLATLQDKFEITSTDIRKKKDFLLDPTALLRGVGLKIEYCNVAMTQYSTTEKILPEVVIIESSGKMGPYVYSPNNLRT